MAAKKKSLPDINIDNGPIVDAAKAASEARAKVAEYTTIEKQHSEKLAQLAAERRKEEAAQQNFIGIVRVTGEEMAPVRVEFRMENGALDLSEEQNLDSIYGSSRPLLFGREQVVTEILDPAALIKELQDAGKNPWDYLGISVKPGLDRVVAESVHVTAKEAFLPKEEFLNTVAEIKSTMSPDAIQYTQSYLETALKPRVVLGTRGKA